MLESQWDLVVLVTPVVHLNCILLCSENAAGGCYWTTEHSGDTQTQTFRDVRVFGGTLRLFWELFFEMQHSMTCGIIKFFLDYLDLKIVGSQNPDCH